jgi:hypothetical protein
VPDILPCPTCHHTPHPEQDHVGYSIACGNCYDEFSPEGWGKTQELAIENWNEEVEMSEDE